MYCLHFQMMAMHTVCNAFRFFLPSQYFAYTIHIAHFIENQTTAWVGMPYRPRTRFPLPLSRFPPAKLKFQRHHLVFFFNNGLKVYVYTPAPSVLSNHIFLLTLTSFLQLKIFLQCAKVFDVFLSSIYTCMAQPTNFSSLDFDFESLVRFDKISGNFTSS